MIDACTAVFGIITLLAPMLGAFTAGLLMLVFEYYGKGTFVHNLNPRVKLSLLFLFTLVVFIVTDFILISAFFFAVLILWLMVRLPVKILLYYCKILLALCALTEPSNSTR
ncbi:MAG: hypothetical protein GX973_04700 [Firmicutes bacterium]|nr:hypothetical protein [Bacillota bacterium]